MVDHICQEYDPLYFAHALKCVYRNPLRACSSENAEDCALSNVRDRVFRHSAVAKTSKLSCCAFEKNTMLPRQSDTRSRLCSLDSARSTPPIGKIRIFFPARLLRSRLLSAFRPPTGGFFMTRALIFFAMVFSSYASAAPLNLNVGQSAFIDQRVLYQYRGRIEVYCGGYQPAPPPYNPPPYNPPPYNPPPYNPPPYNPPGQTGWECVYSCGSKGQERKVGRGWTQDQASREAQRQTCTEYEGGSPKYYQGCTQVPM